MKPLAIVCICWGVIGISSALVDIIGMENTYASRDWVLLLCGMLLYRIETKK